MGPLTAALGIVAALALLDLAAACSGNGAAGPRDDPDEETVGEGEPPESEVEGGPAEGEEEGAVEEREADREGDGEPVDEDIDEGPPWEPPKEEEWAPDLDGLGEPDPEWRLPEGPEPAILSSEFLDIEGVAFSPDGKWLANGAGWQGVIVWRLEDGARIQELNAKWGPAFSPTGDLLAAGVDYTSGQVRLWRTTDWTEWKTMDWGGVFRFSPAASLVATSTDRHELVLRNIDNNDIISVLYDDISSVPLYIRAVEFFPTGEIFARGGCGPVWTEGACEGGITLWSVATGEVLADFRGHHDEVRGLAFSPDRGLLASASGDNDIWIWDIRSPSQPAVLGVPVDGRHSHEGPVNQVAFTSDGRFLLSGGEMDGTVKVWSTRTWQKLHTFPAPVWGGSVWGLAVSPDGRFAAAGYSEGAIALWDLHWLHDLEP